MPSSIHHSLGLATLALVAAFGCSSTPDSPQNAGGTSAGQGASGSPTAGGSSGGAGAGGQASSGGVGNMGGAVAGRGGNDASGGGSAPIGGSSAGSGGAASGGAGGSGGGTGGSASGSGKGAAAKDVCAGLSGFGDPLQGMGAVSEVKAPQGSFFAFIEGPVWIASSKLVFFSDNAGSPERIWSFDPASSAVTKVLEGSSSNGLAVDGQDQLLVANQVDHAIYRLDPVTKA